MGLDDINNSICGWTLGDTFGIDTMNVVSDMNVKDVCKQFTL